MRDFVIPLIAGSARKWENTRVLKHKFTNAKLTFEEKGVSFSGSSYLLRLIKKRNK